MTVLLSEENYEARQIKYKEDSELMLTMTKYSAKGATVDQFRKFVEDPVAVAAVLNNRLTPERLEDDEGHMMLSVQASQILQLGAETAYPV